ncbi:MAG: YceI family protein [Bacteroidota bacterium]|nr:YceI family protein [Bacteroidota bacterium]
MKYISIILLTWMMNFQGGQDLFVCKNAKVSLYSSAPIEDIKAETSTGASVFNAATGELNFSVAINSFKFEKSLMQEHFNSDYMESDKYPRATFKGKIDYHIDVSKDGSYPVNVTGDLTVHNVTMKRTIPGTITVKGGVVNMKAEFMVKCADHHIEIPRIVFHNIAESIKINVAATYAANK